MLCKTVFSLRGLACLNLALTLCLSAAFTPAKATQNTQNDNILMVSLADDAKSENLKTLNAKVTINAPPVFVWQTLTNYERLDDYLPGYEETKLVSGDDNDKVLDVRMNVSHFLPTYKYRVRANENRQTYQLKLTRISGDFKQMNASYQLYPRNNGAQTLLVYHLSIDPGKGLPGFGIAPILKTNTEKTLRAVRQRSVQEHRKSLIGHR